MRAFQIAVLAAALAVVGLASGARAEEACADGQAEFLAGWREFAIPFAPEAKDRTLTARQKARLAAMPHLEAAVAAEPENEGYRVSLAYVCLTAGRYQKAKQVLDSSLALNRDSPTLYLLHGQAEAALAQMEPAEAGSRIEPALESFERAAQLDPENALPLLQAASVAFDVARPDLAQPLLELALAREGCTMHRLPIPAELGSDHPSSLRIWQYVQYEQWSQLIARCENVSKAALRLGAEKEKLGELEAAERHFQQALSVGRAVGAARPNLYISVNAAINLMEDAYSNLLRVAEARESEEAAVWRNELGVVQIGRGMLAGALQGYLQKVATDPPDSAEALLALEEEGLKMIIAGIGLTPASAPEPEVAAPVDPPS